MFNLFVPYYNDKTLPRQKEIDWCLCDNVKNRLIDNIFLFPERPGNTIPKLDTYKVQIINMDKRVSYKDVINYINSLDITKESYNIIANSDISFNETLILLYTINMNDTAIALTRWEFDPIMGKVPELCMVPEQSQDVWIFDGHIKNNIKCDFYFGLRGCDGIFANALVNDGYRVINPVYSIKIFHYHTCPVRHHTENNRLRGYSYDVHGSKI